MPENYEQLLRTQDSIVNFYYCGTQQCKPDHTHGPALRDHFLIHYIHSGKGTFKINNKAYHLEKHQGFLICPGEVFSYKADHVEPWRYSWVAFKGTMVEQYLRCAGLDRENPIFMYQRDTQLEECLEQLMVSRKSNASIAEEVKLLGLTYQLLSLLMDESKIDRLQYAAANRTNYYIERAVDFIYKNYWRKLTVLEIAKYVNLERKYFCSIFKKELKITPQQMLINLRMRKACELLGDRSLDICQIAMSVGYEDSSQFSRMFKRTIGSSPSEFREERDSVI